MVYLKFCDSSDINHKSSVSCACACVQVSCAVRSYWSQLPVIRSTFVVGVYEYFVGIKYYSVIIFFMLSLKAVVACTV